MRGRGSGVRARRRYIRRMDRPAVSLDAEPLAPSRAKWVALGLAAALVGVALALWARHGSSVFVDALGVVASCF